MIKKAIYGVGRWMTEVYSNYAEWVISIVFIAIFLLVCSVAHCEEYSLEDAYNRTITELAPKVSDAKKPTFIDNVVYYTCAVGLIGIGVADMQDHNAVSYICGTPFVVGGCVMIVLKF